MTAGGVAICTMGLILVTSNALAVGVTAIPDPSVDVGADWLWTDTAIVGEEASSSLLGRTCSWARLVVDSKSMRKVQANQALVFVGAVQDGTPPGAAQVNISGQLRFLLKAP